MQISSRKITIINNYYHQYGGRGGGRGRGQGRVMEGQARDPKGKETGNKLSN